MSVVLIMRILIALFVIAVLLLAAGIAGNRPPLTSPPGLVARLKIYLTTNHAATDAAAAFPELLPHDYALSPEQLFAAARATAEALSWMIISEDVVHWRLHAVVVTPIWRFKDDVHLSVEALPKGARLNLESQSRVGRGDLGANTRHILDFYAALDARLGAAVNPRQ